MEKVVGSTGAIMAISYHIRAGYGGKILNREKKGDKGEVTVL